MKKTRCKDNAKFLFALEFHIKYGRLYYIFGLFQPFNFNR
ncbi:hypothetical protein M2480_001819 [Parabacteroides sp. PFB2-12]|nr:hypothetical protein [Parabacteroides sp. PM6-13]MDH6390837.1 hypothetical protein [Parabacteroides sp. PFB2-12]